MTTFIIQGPHNPPPPAPPHGDGNHPACGTSNPPPWCPDIPQVTIDQGLVFLIPLVIMFGILVIIHKRNKNN